MPIEHSGLPAQREPNSCLLRLRTRRIHLEYNAMPERERETIVTHGGGGGGGGAIAAIIAVVAVVAIVLFVFGGEWFGGGDSGSSVTMDNPDVNVETPAPDVNVQAPEAPDVDVETGATEGTGGGADTETQTDTNN
jgi:hypothetical protein